MKSIRAKAHSFALFVALLTSLIGHGIAHSQAQTDFTMAVFASEMYLPDYVAKDKGFGAKHGLNLKFVTPASGAAAAQLMLAGAVQGWTTDPLIIMNAASQGHEIRIAGIGSPDLNYTILVSKDGSWPADKASFKEKILSLKGKRVGVSGIGAGTDNALILLLKSVGLSATDVTRVGIGQQQAAIGQLTAGAIDAFVSFSLAGNAMIQQQTGARLLISTQNPIVPENIRAVPHGGFAVAGEFAAKHPEKVAAWLAAEEESIAWIRANPDEAATILDKYVFNGQQPELAKKIIPQMLTSYFGNTPPGFKVPQKTFAALESAMKDLGKVQAIKPVTYNDVVIPRGRVK